ncbi:MAG TPA: SAM-dependent methyltransferase [Clostridiales bacterium]|nr:SAM-dependent methyltransferase [Clostridiales bacterium]
MELSKRLQAVADLVTSGNRVADVGCDHAYMSIYLAKRKSSPYVLAMDMNEGPLKRANNNIIKYGCQDLIKTRRSNGLEKVEIAEVDTVLIAGMGGMLIVEILSQDMDITKSMKELVLQPQSDINIVRRLLADISYSIIEENMVMEDGKYYVMMKAVPNNTVNESSFELTYKEHEYYGRMLLESKHPVLKTFLYKERNKCNRIISNLKDNLKVEALERRKEIIQKLELIEKALKYYE